MLTEHKVRNMSNTSTWTEENHSVLLRGFCCLFCFVFKEKERRDFLKTVSSVFLQHSGLISSIALTSLIL